jgi:hypothetical protein
MSDSRKRKRPPTFQHYPVNRGTISFSCVCLFLTHRSAKQLKKNWVENVKIKSKWKAEKRKEGITKDVREGEPTDSERDEDEEKSESPPPDAPQIHKYSSRPIPKSAKEQEVVTEPPAVSLRELTREAYSRSSLHTFKADPLKRRRGAPDRGRGGTRGRGSDQRRGGRGQPNMKLRMSAMLEKIKQDYAS